jgi:hypothetical protein
MPRLDLTDDEKNTLIEALDVCIEDASHFGEYGGEVTHIPQYKALKDLLETTLEDAL